jgi:hypothetical protein
MKHLSIIMVMNKSLYFYGQYYEIFIQFYDSASLKGLTNIFILDILRESMTYDLK